MIDTHAHLEATFCDITRVAGLDAVILSAANLETSKNNLKLAEKYPSSTGSGNPPHGDND